MADVVAGYAEAVLSAARAEDALDRVTDEFFHVARTVDGNAELAERLSDPALDVGAKLAIVDDLLADKAHPVTASAVMFVVQAGRARQLGAIGESVAQRAAAARNRVVADVRSARPLDADQIARLAQALSQTTGQQVEVKVTVDADVVGGLVVGLGDTVIDGSLARRLTELRAALTRA